MFAKLRTTATRRGRGLCSLVNTTIAASTVVATVFAATAPASAADMRMPIKAPPPVAAMITNWTGFYIGINGGYSWGRSRDDGSFVTAPGGVLIVAPAGSVLGNTLNLNGGLIGGQVGYN